MTKIKTKPFNGELAIKGHPCVTKNLKRVTHIVKLDDSYSYKVENSSIIYSVNKKGMGDTNMHHSLFLEDTKWEYRPKCGDKVWVSNNVTPRVWQEKIFLYKSNGLYACMDSPKNCMPKDYSFLEPIKPMADIKVIVNGHEKSISHQVKTWILENLS